ncbi:MAG: AAA family ATPase [Candidatus Marinamargulisbacteria bacterium]
MTDTRLSGCVHTIIFSNPDSNYAVVLLSQTDGEVVVTGPLADVSVGDFLQVQGTWVAHPVHKQQFKVTGFTQMIPATNDELVVFLSTGVITGIGPHYAKILVKTFGDALVHILDNDIKKLLSVPGIGDTKLNQISQSWRAQREQLSFLTFILDHGLDVVIGKRIWRLYYGEALRMCQEQPYHLISTVPGLTFKMADQLAGDGTHDSEARVLAAIHDVFRHYFKSPHVWMPFDDFFRQLNQRLRWDEGPLMERLQALIFDQTLPVIQDDNHQKWVTSTDYNQTELAIMDGLDQFMVAPLVVAIDALKAVDWVREKVPYTLAPDQLDALTGVLSHPLSVLYGGPGTGKTSMLHAYVQVVSKKTDRIICMAPTGKAAKRMSERIGRRASTIHAMMDYDEKSHTLTPKPLDCDVCIIDEMSMVDMHLFLDVLAMVPLGARLVLVGDPDQLPSIGPGQVFSDIIHQSNIPSFRLRTNHRQATHRGITTLAEGILNRRPPSGDMGADLTCIHAPDEATLEGTLLDLFLTDVVKQFSVTMDDIQLIVPIHKGRFGISNLNQKIAHRVRALDVPPSNWVVGDRVIQCKNNYSKRVMNGDIGHIQRITSDEITIAFQHDSVGFEPSEMVDIQLAYAVSIHKFQGSEAPIIILPIVKQWGFFMSMDVLYTAVTRAKTHLFVVGDMTVFHDMIMNAKTSVRLTRLFRK